jgi:SAM-dependent methyltransferase
MATLDRLDYALHLPPRHVRDKLDQDEEWCEIEIDGARRRIRFHDYAAIFDVPGLYERLFAEQLDCDSPRVVCELLGAQLQTSRVKTAGLCALDFGAGNGMVGERLAELGIDEIVGVDLLAQARDAAHRDRPGLYAAGYHALDMTRLAPADRATLMRHDFDVMTCVAALGFGDIPPLAFAEAFNLVGSPGWVAFNLRDRYIEERDASGFGAFIARMLDEGILAERARKSYTHRVSVAGEALEYVAIVAEKRADVPLGWAREAGS